MLKGVVAEQRSIRCLDSLVHMAQDLSITSVDHKLGVEVAITYRSLQTSMIEIKLPHASGYSWPYVVMKFENVCQKLRRQ